MAPRIVHGFPKKKEKARALAEDMGRTDVVIAFGFIEAFGLRIEEMCKTKLEYLMSALKTGQLVVPKGKGGQMRAITLSLTQRALIVRYVEYFQTRGLRPGDYLISNSEKHGVLNEKRSLQNWMSYNREKFMVKDRDKIVEDGKKKRPRRKPSNPTTIFLFMKDFFKLNTTSHNMRD